MTNPAPRLAAGLLLCLTSTMTAQVLPLLDPARVRLISQEISGDAAFKHVRYLSMLHRPRVSEKLWEAATYVETEARKAGLERIALIKQPFAQPPWNTHFADLWVAGDRPERIASTIQNDVHLAEHSRPTDLTAELIDIGSGTATDIGAREVRGKVVLTTGEIETVMRETVLGRGAAGIVVFPDPDVPPNGIVGAGPIMRGEIFCLIDGKRSGWDIYRLVAAEAREAGAVYYGLVTPGQVAEALGAIAATGLVRLVTVAVPAR